LLLALLERHRGTGQVGTGLVTGLGLRRGALASTVAHDAHHLIVAGADEDSMLAAVRALVQAGGGLAVAARESVDVLPLPLAGLMTDRPAGDVARDLRRLEARAAALGVTLANPFMTLSFLSLSVIPTLKITVSGLVDVDAQRLVPVLLD
jgi:adenine deaminase